MQDLVLLGELEHGVYDECSELTEEVNAFYGFDNEGLSLDIDNKLAKEDSDNEMIYDLNEDETNDDFMQLSEDKALVPGNRNFDTTVSII